VEENVSETLAAVAGLTEQADRIASWEFSRPTDYLVGNEHAMTAFLRKLL
jgi:hypothetical protein